MQQFVALIGKDVRLLVRDPVALAFLLLAPAVVISVAGFSLSSFYGSQAGSEAEFLLPIVNADEGEIGAEIVSELTKVEGLRVSVGTEEEARRSVGQTYRAGAALIIPAGFTDGFRRGEPVRLRLLTDPVKHLEILRIKAAVERVQAALVTSQVAGRIAVVEVLTHAGEVNFEAVARDASELASRLVQKSVAVEEQSLTSTSTFFNTFDQNVPGFSVTFLLLGMLLGIGLGLLDEREWGMLYRLAASPVPPTHIVTGKVTARAGIGLVQMGVLFIFGRIFFGVSLGPSILTLFLVITGITFASAAFGLLVAALAPSRDAVLPLGTIAIMAMAAIGGCWWPITIEPLWLQKLAHLFPTAWAMEAFNDIMLRGRGWADVRLSVLVLLLFGAVYLALGSWLYVRREARSR